MSKDENAAAVKRTKITWNNMRSRCKNEYYYYNNGIRVCSRWNIFDNFVADMGLRPENTSIDRIDGNGDYEPENCRWSNKEVQSKNKVAYGKRVKRPIDAEIFRDISSGKKKIMIRYPSRIEALIVKKVNKVRKNLGLSWPELTTMLLKEYLAENANS